MCIPRVLLVNTAFRTYRKRRAFSKGMQEDTHSLKELSSYILFITRPNFLSRYVFSKSWEESQTTKRMYDNSFGVIAHFFSECWVCSLFIRCIKTVRHTYWNHNPSNSQRSKFVGKIRDRLIAYLDKRPKFLEWYVLKIMRREISTSSFLPE